MDNIKNTPKRIKKKDLILDSAVSIFSEYGYNNTKLEQITKSLDLTDKSIYYYFSSKGDLFIETVLSIQAKLDKLIESINKMDINHLEKIKTYTNKAMSINGLTLLMQLPKSLSEFAKYDLIKSNEANQYKIWTSWFKKGQIATQKSIAISFLDLYFTCIIGMQLRIMNHMHIFSHLLNR